MARLRTSHPSLRLYLVGDGESRADLSAQTARLGLESAVFFVGKVDQHDLPDWYRAADLTVLASRSEGVPHVLRESLACRTPFVATRVGGVHEIAAGTTNLLVDPEDAVALSDAIAASLAAPAPDGAGGRRMTWQESTQEILDILARAR